MQSCTRLRIFESWGLGGFIINIQIDLTDYANGLRNLSPRSDIQRGYLYNINCLILPQRLKDSK